MNIVHQLSFIPVCTPGFNEKETDSVTVNGNKHTVTETTSAYDIATGNPSCVTDALGKTASYAYDMRGRKTAEWGTGIQPASFAYDDADRLISLTTWRASDEEITTNPSGRTDGDTTTWTYHESGGLVLRKTYADGTHEDSEYNALNMLVKKTDAREIVTTYTWDTNKGVYTGIDFSDGTPTQNFTYNHIGNMYKVVDASGTREISYNIYNEQETDGITVNGSKHIVTETFDSLGRSSGYVLGKGSTTLDTVAYGYGAEGRLVTASFLHGGEEKIFTYSYLEGTNLLHTLAHPNNILITRTYEQNRDLITSMNATRGTTNVVLRGYTYDELGRPVTRTCSRQAKTRNDTFAYNDRSELVSASLGTDPYAYAYDNIGNRETAQEAAQALTTYDTNPLNQYSSIVKGSETSFLSEYDAAGNQTKIKTSTGIWTVTYDANNRPVSFTSEDAQTVIACGYDCLGRRFMKKVTVNGTITLHQFYLYRGYLQIAALDMTRSNLAVQWFTHWDPTEPVATRPLSIRKNATWYTYGHDLTKNVTELYNTIGGIATVYDYTPYGAVTASGIEQPFQWSSEVYDAELGMVYYNYRHYNPSDGRWIARDPIGEESDLNVYRFVKNRLIIDYLGLKGNPPIWSNYPWLPPDNQQAINGKIKEQLKKFCLDMGTNNGCELLGWLMGQGLSGSTLFPIPPGADLNDLLNGRLLPPSLPSGPTVPEKPIEPPPTGITGSFTGSITGNTGELTKIDGTPLGFTGTVGAGIDFNGKPSVTGSGGPTTTPGKDPSIGGSIGGSIKIPTGDHSGIYAGGSVDYNSRNGWGVSGRAGWQYNF